MKVIDQLYNERFINYQRNIMFMSQFKYPYFIRDNFYFVN